MTKQEAILQAKQGKKITHTHFSKDEWFTIREDDKVVLEDGVICSQLEFWYYRKDFSWETGYRIFE